jgi:uncharacterized OsmC-like protein
MADTPFPVVASSGDLRPSSHGGVEFRHHWTHDGVVVESEFTGAHLLHLSIAGCVLNDVHREAERLGVTVDGVRVAAWGDFDRETWQSTGIGYSVEVSSPASSDAIDELLRIVDDVAEIPKALRSATTVERI